MQTQLDPRYQGTPEGQQAEAILRKCVHCGFCTATCPTYQLLGDERDGPRGRIYLIKQVLEGATPSVATQAHLDRCLTCRNCESTCPSGVQYGALVEIGRRVVDEQVPRPAGQRALRWLLREGLTSPLFKPALGAGRWLRPLLPAALAGKLPARRPARAHLWPQREHPRKVLLLLGCVQPAMMPNVNSATARVLDACGIQTLVADEAGCCGAIRAHLGDHDGGLADMRRNIDAWWPVVQRGEVEAIVMNASGCGAMVKDYGTALAAESEYADKARRISALTRDLSELLPELLPVLTRKLGASRRAASDSAAAAAEAAPLAYHPPCTLQHGQQLKGGVEAAFQALGRPLRTAGVEAHLCCGSAGTYSVLQPQLAQQLRNRKLAQLAAAPAATPSALAQAPAPEPVPSAILSGNVGCIQHLQSGTRVPVMHWVEWLDEQLAE